MRRPDCRSLALLCGLAAYAAPCLDGSGRVHAQSTEQELQRIEREIESSRQWERTLESRVGRLDRGLKSMRGELIDAAASVQTHEERISDIEARLQALSAEEHAKARDLRERHGELSSIIATLALLGRRPPETLVSASADPVVAVRGAILLASAIPGLRSRVRELRAELTALRDIRNGIEDERAELAHASETLARERQALDRLLMQTSRLHEKTLGEWARSRERIARLAKEARDLRALLRELQKDEERLARESPGAALVPGGGGPFAGARGKLPLPARGRLVTRFGERNRFGTRNQGLTVATRASAQVVAPYDGRLMFAGPFRGYGQLLIISHGEGYHSLIAGMSRIDGVVGQWLLAGEPIGRMGGNDGGGPVLYMELRRNGAPIDPLPWLASSERKVSG